MKNIQIGRGVFLLGIASLSAIIMVSVWILFFWQISQTSKSLLFAIGIGIASWLFAWSKGITFFLVAVPANVGLVTKDQFDGSLRVYRQGLHIKFPWEVYEGSHFMSAEAITVAISESFPTKDGGVVNITGSFQYQPALQPQGSESFDDADKRFILYFLAEERTIVISFYNHIVSILRGQITNKTAASLRNKLDKIDEAVETAMSVGSDVGKMEKEYGVNFNNLELATISFSTETQNALNARFTNQQLISLEPSLRNKNSEALRHLRIISGHSKETVEIKRIEGLENIHPDVARAVSEGLAIAGTVMGRGRGQRPNQPNPVAQPALPPVNPPTP